MSVIDTGYNSLLPVGRGTDINARHSYINPSVDVGDNVTPRTGPVDNSSIARPGQPIGTGGEKQEIPHSAPASWEDRERGLSHLDYGFNPVTGPSTEVAVPIAHQNFTLDNPRWTGKKAPRVYRYTREFAQRFVTFGNGMHFANTQYAPLPKVKSRTMNRNRLTPRNVPQPLDDQVVDTSNRTQYGTIFNSPYNGWK